MTAGSNIELPSSESGCGKQKIALGKQKKPHGLSSPSRTRCELPHVGKAFAGQAEERGLDGQANRLRAERQVQEEQRRNEKTTFRNYVVYNA